MRYAIVIEKSVGLLIICLRPAVQVHTGRLRKTSKEASQPQRGR